MNLDFTKAVKADGYVSPSVDQTMVNAEKGFCISGMDPAYHDAFDEFEYLN